MIVAALVAAGFGFPTTTVSQDSDMDTTSRKPAPQAALSMDMSADKNGPTIRHVAGVRQPYWAEKGCEHGHRSAVAYERIRALVRHTRPAVRKRDVQHWATCLATRAKAHRAHVLARGHWRWRHQYAQRYRIIFNRLPSWDRAWAVSTGACESGNNPATNTGNGFHGAFQFVLSTWYAAGGSGMPEGHSWHYQAVIAVRWMHIAGDEQWPVCGD